MIGYWHYVNKQNPINSHYYIAYLFSFERRNNYGWKRNTFKIITRLYYNQKDNKNKTNGGKNENSVWKKVLCTVLAVVLTAGVSAGIATVVTNQRAVSVGGTHAKSAYDEIENSITETSPYSQYSISDSGYCGAYGENVVWNYYSEINAIEFVGNGEIKDYSYYDESGDIPWYYYRESIEQVYISESITRVGNRVFEGFDSITKIMIPNSVESIGSYEFWSCDNLTDIYLSSNIVEIGDSAFGFCDSLKSIHYSGTQEEWDTVSIAEDAFNNTTQDVSIYFE